MVAEQWVGTFGVGQERRLRFVRFDAPDQAAAHAVMTDAYGTEWSRVYTAEDFEGQAERWGLTEIPFRT